MCVCGVRMYQKKNVFCVYTKKKRVCAYTKMRPSCLDTSTEWLVECATLRGMIQDVTHILDGAESGNDRVVQSVDMRLECEFQRALFTSELRHKLAAWKNRALHEKLNTLARTLQKYDTTLLDDSVLAYMVDHAYLSLLPMHYATVHAELEHCLTRYHPLVYTMFYYLVVAASQYAHEIANEVTMVEDHITHGR